MTSNVTGQNKQGPRGQPYLIPTPISNLGVIPCASFSELLCPSYDVLTALRSDS